jgi:hypothetical protein
MAFRINRIVLSNSSLSMKKVATHLDCSPPPDLDCNDSIMALQHDLVYTSFNSNRINGGLGNLETCNRC